MTTFRIRVNSKDVLDGIDTWTIERGERLTKAVRESVSQVQKAVQSNLSGRYLGVRTGRLRSSFDEWKGSYVYIANTKNTEKGTITTKVSGFVRSSVVDPKTKFPYGFYWNNGWTRKEVTPLKKALAFRPQKGSDFIFRSRFKAKVFAPRPFFTDVIMEKRESIKKRIMQSMKG